ncbi:calpain-2 catalytic subunit-like [Chanos chanos]|uniref:Calpain-2 catalytic subunit-like n=1 Tax=Chanos chanos TaxID=29144 RepID=A0A6J2V7U7_CHACN|nr:calpain-2 catalytic subunit-like [Chanos chanos]
MTSMAYQLAHMRERAKGIGTRNQAVKFCQQDFETLRAKCLQTRRLFEDNCFPAESKSLGYNELGPYSYKTKGIVWKRPTELYANPTFIHDGATRTDICQGDLGDCWLLAAIASLTLQPKILARVVPPGQSFEENYAGIFHFQFWQFGEWVDVVVDDRLPTRDGELLFVHSETGSEFWSALLEKAYAKLNGSYEALIGGCTTEGFEDFTGGIAETYQLNNAPPYLFKIIQKALGMGSLLGCSIDISNIYETEAKTPLKLVKGHAYSVTGAEVVSVRGRSVELIRIRNPWGKVEWIGPWSDNSSEWNLLSRYEKIKLEHVAEDGEFWMSFSDFVKEFSRLEICNLTPDALTSEVVRHWNYHQFEGTWRVGSTAGGCLNHPATFPLNPQFAVTLEDVDDDPLDGKGGCTILVELMQKGLRQERRLGRDTNTIGFTIYKVPDEYKGRRNVRLGADVLLRQNPVALSSTFINTREVCDRFTLPPDDYVIIPSTFQPHKTGNFILRVFTEKQASTRVMEEVIDAEIEEPAVSKSDIDPHLEYLFKKTAGKNSEISVLELVPVLNQAISERPGLNTRGFSMETGRNIVSLLDKDGSAKLSLIELHILWQKIKKYVEIFKKHDKDYSGMMNSHEMREALSEAGFHVDSAVLQIIVSRYANAQYTLDFDSFVSCLIRLEMLFRMFKMLDPGESGTIKLNMMQWLCLAIN